MPFLELVELPSGPVIAPLSIHYREYGRGAPLLFLHGGWGYGMYPIGRQVEEFQSEWRIVAPDRCGYGRSTHVMREMPLDFHRQAAEETMAVMDALEIERAAIWGHSDGAVIAAMIGLKALRNSVASISSAICSSRPLRTASVTGSSITIPAHFARDRSGSRAPASPACRSAR